LTVAWGAAFFIEITFSMCYDYEKYNSLRGETMAVSYKQL